jgi:SAM-dependent methyltransferase
MKKRISKYLSYLRYFFFIGKNWNYRLAAFTIYHEIAGEKKYGITTTEIDRLKRLETKGPHRKNASIYQGSNYFLLQKAFTYLQNELPGAGLVDFGCGKGRVLAVAAYFKSPRITGIDFAAALCAEAKINIEAIRHWYPGTQFYIICDDAVNYDIRPDDKFFFFFNPFDEQLMLQVVKNISRSLKEFPREMIVIYINPLHKEIFQSAGFIEEYYLRKMTYLEMSILSITP